MRYDVVIIGAGMSGLAAGIRLAHFGKKTLILERHYRVGGLNSFYRAGGYELDVGLHAFTNYNPKGPKSAPLARLLRRLRLRLDDLGLYPQKVSRIVFPDVTLECTNDIEHLLDQIDTAFPGQAQNFQKLINKVYDLYDRDFETEPASGREVVSSIITEPYLVEMLFCPLMFYGCAQEDDMDFRQFALLFLSVFCEGFARPKGGIRPMLDMLVGRFENNGGELRLRAGVERIEVSGGKVAGVALDNEESIECDAVLSSAGLLETIAICPEAKPQNFEPQPGRLSFIESINVIDRPAPELGIDASITFYNNGSKFRYRRPEDPVDVESGVICAPDNFCYDKPLKTHMVRITHIADPDFWINAGESEYEEGKALWRERSFNAAQAVVPRFSDHVIFHDMFTPRTIKQFTGHVNGAVYGSPVKLKSGGTPVENLYICGTDQGYLGVVGSMISGVGIANQRLLR